MSMLIPNNWAGPASEVDWISELGPNTWCSLFNGWAVQDLPLGYDRYVVSFHLEAVNIQWVNAQADRVQAPVILLSDSDYYDWKHRDNVFPFTYYWWHHQTEQMQKWWPTPVEKNIKYKASAYCNRISQSKLLIFTALYETMKDQALLTLNDWLIDENIPNQKSGSLLLDKLHQIFFSEHFGKIIKHDNWNNSTQNMQNVTSNPWTESYQECALHFTNESFHYSLMQDYIWPGPFITEKTLKCLLGATGFVPVGQYDTLGSLERVGFKFDYDFDTNFDQDPGNITRLEKIVQLILKLNNYSAKEIFEMTKASAKHNQHHIFSGEFYNTCEYCNQKTLNDIFDKFIR